MKGSIKLNKYNIIILVIFFLVFTIILLNKISNISKLMADTNSSLEYTNLKVGTFNIGSWKCGNGFQGATCNNANNIKISELFTNNNLDIIGIQEAATFDENNNPLSGNIYELANMSNLNLKYVNPYQINALLFKKSISNINNEDEYNALTNCTYTHNNYMEKRALIKEIIEVGGTEISVYNTHIGHSNCNSIHFSDIANIISTDSNPIIIMGDFNKVSSEGYETYLKPLGFEVAAYDNNFANNGTDSYADAIFVKSKNKIEILSSNTINTYNDYSDHNLVVANLKVKKSEDSASTSISSLNIKNNIVKLNKNSNKSTIANKLGNNNFKVLNGNTEITNDLTNIKTGYTLNYNNKDYLISILGDANSDGNVDGADISRTYKIYRGLYNSETVERYAADANEDDSIDGADISRIYKIYKNFVTYDVNSMEAYFLNTQLETKTKKYYANESIIFKTKNNKIIMIDTADEDQEIQNVLLNKLREVSGNEHVTIDYLIISHSHEDHYGNLVYLLKNPNVTINNIIYKKLNLSSKVENDIANNYTGNVIDTSSLNEDIHKIEIDNVTISLFNLDDVYKNQTKENCNKDFYIVKFSSNATRDAYVKYNNKYVYLNSLNPDDKILKYSDNIENVTNTLGLESGIPIRRYYAYIDKRTSACSQNSNSIAALLEVKTQNDKKYIYIPSDLSNNGYSYFGTYNQSALNQGFKYGTIYSDGVTYVFENNYTENGDLNNKWTITNNSFVDTNSIVKRASESRVANQIKNYLGEDELNNIIIYQRSHHGFNDAKDAIDTLNLNRKNVYSIALHRNNGKNSPDSLLARGYHYTLDKTTRLNTGSKSDGIHCYIKEDSSYKCE